MHGLVYHGSCHARGIGIAAKDEADDAAHVADKLSLGLDDKCQEERYGIWNSCLGKGKEIHGLPEIFRIGMQISMHAAANDGRVAIRADRDIFFLRTILGGSSQPADRQSVIRVTKICRPLGKQRTGLTRRLQLQAAV